MSSSATATGDVTKRLTEAVAQRTTHNHTWMARGTTMSNTAYARYIGRVWGLAVVLGVGVAVARTSVASRGRGLQRDLPRRGPRMTPRRTEVVHYPCFR